MQNMCHGNKMLSNVLLKITQEVPNEKENIGNISRKRFITGTKKNKKSYTLFLREVSKF